MTLSTPPSTKNPRFLALPPSSLVSHCQSSSPRTSRVKNMAAELLRHQSSRAYYDSNHSGCMWGLLHFLDLDRHHRHKRKMITYKRHGDGNHGGGTKILTSAQNVISTDQEHLLDKEAKFQMENKMNTAKKSSGASHLISLLYKKLTKKSKRKLKDSPSAARLLRTISIHHLECDDYVLPDDMISSTDSSIVELTSSRTDFSASSEQASGIQNTLLGTGVVGQNILVLPRDKTLPSVPNAAEEFLQDPGNGVAGLDRSSDLTQKIKDVIKEEHRIYMDGVLDKIPFGHKIPDGAEMEKENRSGDGPRSRFGSEGFVSNNSKFAHRSIQRSRSLTESLDKYSHLLESSLVREAQRLPQRSNSVKEQDSKLASRRFLSRSLSESLDRYSHLLEFISVREPQRPPQRLCSVKEQEKNSAQGRVLWSRSLSESFDRYHLLESISAKGPQRLPQRSNSVKEQDSNSAHRRILRSRSLSESFDRYPHLLESASVREPKRQPERLKSIQEDGLQDMKSQVAEVGSFSFSNDIPREVSSLSAKEPDSDLLADDVKVDACISDEPNSVGVHANTEENLETDSSLEQPEFIDKHDQGEACVVSDDLIADDSRSIPQDYDVNEAEGNPSDKPTESSPVSILDLYIEEDPLSPVKYAESQGAELQSSSVHFEEQDSGVKQENKLSTMVELNKADSYKGQVTTESDEDVEFNFVKDVLNKSGFGEGAEEFLAAWYSSCEPVDQLLAVEEPETRRHDSSFDQLLLDLINEILLEVYASTIAHTTGLLRFCPHIRPVPVGDHLLEEVWTKVSQQLGSEQDMNHSIERIEARDYAKNDGWMNVQWDVERVGVYLEGLILDDLIDEIVVDLVDV